MADQADNPLDAAALYAMGYALLAEGRPAQAVAMLSAAAESGYNATVLNDLASALILSGQAHEAEQRLREAIELEPSLFHPLFNLGGLLLSRGSGEALGWLRLAYAADPAGPDVVPAMVSALLAEGNAAYGAGRLIEAETLYREAIAMQPQSSGGFANLGNALAGQLRTEEAVAAYQSALALAPWDDTAGFAYGLCLLRNGRDHEGWAEFERRRSVPALRHNYLRHPHLPQWQSGLSLAGRRVLVTAEQGYGDLIQYARFVPALARVAAGVVLEVPWTLAGIFDDLPGVGRQIGLGEPAADCDIACPLLSLPLLLGTEAGIAPPYVTPSPPRVGRWANWLDRSRFARRVGLVCSGDPRHPLDQARSIPLADFAPVLAVPGVSFVLVQTEIRASDRPAFDAFDDLRCPAAALTDYADTAALLSGLDLLISVDTSAAHLAGAMGLPIWTLLPFCPDYRWKLGSDDTAWYPSMRLYRQQRPGDWETVIRRVRDDLARL
ncbi:MAG TPA: hypothetical protein DDZ81_01785 [Acetobacteraceae bacterium]|jgi:tetratricopeptide (TPR) repeat protein|nr:hypothetical protein [Acetobacteraceae bacterium]